MVLRVAIVDTGALYATIDSSDAGHQACTEALSNAGLRLIFPALTITEVCQLIEKRLGSNAEAQFLATLESYDIRAPMPEDWARISKLVRRYANFPLGAVDASVVTLAERMETDTVITVDRRHFSAIKPRHCEYLQLLP